MAATKTKAPPKKKVPEKKQPEKAKPPEKGKPAGKGKPAAKAEPKIKVVAGAKKAGAEDDAETKKSARIQIPQVGAGKIGILVWSAFTHAGEVDDKGVLVPHWNKQPVKDNVVRSVTVAIGKSTISKPTDDNGRTRLDLTGLLDGTHDLRFEPAADELGTVAAGPDLIPGLTTNQPALRTPYPAKETAYAERMYRPFTLRVTWRNGAMSGTPTFVGSSDHVHLIRQTPNGLEIDWKPDWVRARNLLGRTIIRDMGAVVLHRTDGATIGSTLSKFMEAPAKGGGFANAHYVIDTDGFVVMMATELEEAAHAGRDAQWQGQYPLNMFSYGIECVNAGGDFPKAQLQALARLLRALIAKHHIRKDRILGHGEVSPLKKNDNGLISNERRTCPGDSFDWPYLEKQLVAAAPLPRDSTNTAITNQLPLFFRDPAMADQALQLDDTDRLARYAKKDKRFLYGETIERMQALLREVGYEIGIAPAPKLKGQKPVEPRVVPKKGEYDAAMVRVVERFQTRYFTKRGEAVPQMGDLDRPTARMITRVLLGRNP